MAGLKLLVLAVFFLGLANLLPAKTQAFDFFSNSNNSNSVCKSPDASSSPVCQTPKQPNNPIVNTIRITTSVLALLAGILAVIMIIVSGFTMVTSGGNQEAVTNSRKRITSSIIGLVIVGLAWTIIRIVTDKIIQ
jgi:type IV secretory pathway VirB2 component (pilin)